MYSIVTITFNPCIDKSFTTETIIPDRKLVCSQPRIDPGGGGINVARAIRKLGGSALAVYPASGPHGQLLTEMLTGEQVPVSPIQMRGDTRENINVTELSTNRQFRFVVQGPALDETAWTKCLAELQAVGQGGYIVLSGSLPETWPADIFLRVKKIAAEKKAHLIVDTSGKALLTALQGGVYMIKPSLRELDSLARIMGWPTGSPLGTASHIVADGLAEIVVISAGPEGAKLVTTDMVREFRAPEVQRQSTVGAGDSMVAGIVLSLSRGMSLVEAVKYGVACGTAAVMNPGTALCRNEDVSMLYPKVESLQPA
jgi:6-phosphofructokinase 2